jgi:hypothetical protein
LATVGISVVVWFFFLKKKIFAIFCEVGMIIWKLSDMLWFGQKFPLFVAGLLPLCFENLPAFPLNLCDYALKFI